jgi:hypothetical protein
VQPLGGIGGVGGQEAGQRRFEVEVEKHAADVDEEGHWWVKLKLEKRKVEMKELIDRRFVRG